jgi:hypothetical protein
MPIATRGNPINTLKGTWTRLYDEERLRRSSHVLSVIGQTVCIFGGEVQPRQPVDDQVDVLSLTADAPKLETKKTSTAPSPRVGSASALLADRLYLFSGRGGTDMAPIDEKGSVWNYDPASGEWSQIKPNDVSQPYPEARSYHCAASDGEGGLFIHAGCPDKGRLQDLWRFDVFSRSWLQLPDAPPPQRGGTSLAYSGGKLYRMNGFDGEKEQGGSIDIFDIEDNSWSTETWPTDGNSGPEPRSVAALLPIKLRAKDKLLTLFGERDPSSQGHAGAGKPPSLSLTPATLYSLLLQARCSVMSGCTTLWKTGGPSSSRPALMAFLLLAVGSTRVSPRAPTEHKVSSSTAV